MKKMIVAKWIAVMVTVLAQAAGATVIEYSVVPTGDSGRWNYEYSVLNNGTEPIKAFTIWFDVALASDYLDQSTVGIQADWGPIFQLGVADEEGILRDGFDVLTNGSGILPGQTLDGFIVNFKWIGLDDPGVQGYDIYDASSFKVISSGTTVPEPATLLMLALGSGGWWYGHKKHPS